MNEPESVVFVVDDDPSVRSAIKRLIGSMGLQVELFGSAQEFLASKLPNVPSCLVLDIRLAGNQRTRLTAPARRSQCSDSDHFHHCA